ncbi:MAG: hypothetical protein AAB433_03750 [Nitrospirota bacterium]
MLKLHTFFSVASCRYLVITALAAILSWTSAEAANAPTTYLDADLGDKLENLGRLYDEATQGLKTGARQIVIGPSEKEVPVISEIIRRTAVFSTQQLRPAGNDAIQGGGTNITRNGSCVVGYQDNGTGTPYHAFRWLLNGASSTPLDLGTLGNATLQSFATDANLDCSVVVGYGDIVGGATQHAFRWTSGGMIDLGGPAGGGPSSRALGASNDGSVIVGEAEFPAGAFTRKGAFRWAGGSFADLIPGNTPSLATARFRRRYRRRGKDRHIHRLQRLSVDHTKSSGTADWSPDKSSGRGSHRRQRQRKNCGRNFPPQLPGLSRGRPRLEFRDGLPLGGIGSLRRDQRSETTARR